MIILIPFFILFSILTAKYFPAFPEPKDALVQAIITTWVLIASSMFLMEYYGRVVEFIGKLISSVGSWVEYEGRKIRHYGYTDEEWVLHEVNEMWRKGRKGHE